MNSYAQAVEKYLKCNLVYNDIIPQKTHNLVLLNDKCIETDSCFQEIKMECGFLNRYSNEIRYPYRIQIYEEDVIYVIKSVEKTKNLEALKKIRAEITAMSNEQ